MLQRFLTIWRSWAEVLAEADDPEGEYLLNLEKRVRFLEGQLRMATELRAANSASTATPTADSSGS